MISALEWCLGRFSLDLGIDLGTANTLVCVAGQGIVMSEPSVVAVQRGSNRVLLDGNAVGESAKEMLGKTPGSIVAIRPLKDGVIADFEITEAMLRYFIRKVHNRTWGVKPRVVIAIPSGITAVEKRAVINSAERAGARKVFLIDEPLAAGIGAGLPITEPIGSMIVDIGGGTTEIAVISMAGTVTAQSLRIAGDEMDEAISAFMRKNYSLMIGEQTSENIKIAMGSAYALEEEVKAEVKGRDLIAGLPRKAIIGSEEVRQALNEPVMAIIDAIRSTLEKTAPELAADIVDSGITLAGGGALLRGLAKRIEEEINLPVRIADDPLTCVARGTGEILEQLPLLRQVIAASEDL
jgi:rod shape-determining protein MreB and related proteins